MAEAKMRLVEWLDDLSVRFLLNLPPSELSSVPRLCFQVEEAQWYYEDFVRPLAAASGNPLPSLPLRAFCLALFQHCPLLSGFTDAQHIAAYEEFLAYKVRVPVRGAILLDERMERVLLVRGWKKGASWSFPRGKINKDEKDLDCAIREVYEETGFDIGASGLVPESDRDAKYFDITMREQHMRMFVFRGVPLDTFFEPRTRKEIGKIDWYELQNLPGFAKKNKHNGEGGNANKFYMVAPFMNPLKKWIGQQHRKDAAIAQTEEQLAVHGLSAYQEVDEPDTDAPEVTPEPAAILDRSDELKRLLSIGGAAPAPSLAVTQPPQGLQADNLLKMLQGGAPPRNAPPPQTPMEQIHAFAPVPETPQPHHPRQLSLGNQQPPPQFPFSPPAPRHEQQLYNFAMPNSNANGQTHNGVFGLNGMQRGMPMQNITQHQPNLPSMLPQQPAIHFGSFQHPQQQYPSMLPDQTNPQRTVNAPMGHPSQPNHHPGVPIQGPQGAIAAGPSVPRASQLPPPKLNAHSMMLLDAFKSGNNPPQTSSATGNASRPSGVHQAALLGLFKAPSRDQALPAPQAHVASQQPPSGATDEIPRQPSTLESRRPSALNEITRTLPMHFKPKRPSQPSSNPPVLQYTQNDQPRTVETKAPAATTSAQEGSPQPRKVQEYLSSPGSRSPAPTSHVSNQATNKHQARKNPPPSQTQRVSQRQPTTSRQAKQHQLPGKSPKTSNGASVAPSVPFTILTRPGSEKGKTASSANPTDEQLGASPRPQILRKPDSSDEGSQSASAPIPASDGARESNGNRDHLLSLFGKPQRQSASPSPGLEPAVPISSPSPASVPPANTNKNALLDLFGSSTAQQPHPPRSDQPAPPEAPYLAPSHKPVKPKTPTAAPMHTRTHTPQNPLLDLFKKPTNTTSVTGSPETPISPFTLGSPNMVRHQGVPSKMQQGQTQQGGERSRLGSFASSGRGTPTSAGTPTEAKDKDFLLGFLNGVVQKEGRAK